MDIALFLIFFSGYGPVYHDKNSSINLWDSVHLNNWYSLMHSNYHKGPQTKDNTYKWELCSGWMAVNSSSVILHDAYFQAELGNQITSLYIGVKYCVFQRLSYTYCRVLSIFPTIFILLLEYYGHHTGLICCSFDQPPRDDHISMAGFLKMTTF